MNNVVSPETMWSDRADQLDRDFQRVKVLLDRDLEQQNRALGGKFRVLLGDLDRTMGTLKESAGGPDQWGALRNARALAEPVFATQLELLGGAAITNGIKAGQAGLDDCFAQQAETWLNQLRQGAGLNGELTVIVGRGPALAADLGVVHIPFLEWDLWSLPLLARAVGLLAAEDRSPDSRLRAAIELLAPELDTLRMGSPPAPLKGPGDWQTRYLQHLFADMFTTVLLGPVYALAVFALDLDYGNPEQYGLENPELIDDQPDAPRFLPTPAQRAAAILETLQIMNENQNRPPNVTHPYGKIIQRITQLWAAAPDVLQAARDDFQAWHRVLYDEAIREGSLRLRPAATEQTWRRARAWYEEINNSSKSPQRDPPAMPEQMTECLTMLWRCRIDDPRHASFLCELAEQLMRGQQLELPPLTDAQAPASVVLRIWLERLERRWQRLEGILKDKRVPPERRAAVAGRFYRMLSAQIYHLEQKTGELQREPITTTTWSELAALEDSARPLLREALEFLGGLLIHERGFDCEPAEIAGRPDAPSTCALADWLLEDYARRTGVNWRAGTVPGRDPFLEPTTDIIRLRFPDWSVWNLPAMAHEFGHVAAPATPGFRSYQRQAAAQAGPTEANGAPQASLIREHLEEFFADIFATYTVGPAFACDAILLMFNPAEAYASRSGHPAHQERVNVILQTLGQMNEKTRNADFPGGRYRRIAALLQQSWETAVQDAQATPAGPAANARRHAQVARWAADIYTLIDTYFRLGAGYTPERWAWAQKTAGSLVPLQTSIPRMRQNAADAGLGDLLLDDILNVLWWARVGLPGGRPDVGKLTDVALELGGAFRRS